MFEAVMKHYKHADIVIKSAAVADYRPKSFITKNEEKRRKFSS